MSRPTQRSWRQLKQLGRYLVGKADMTWEYKAGAWTDMIDVHADSDWAGDRQQRKSISGGLVIVGWIAVKSWSRTQRGRSLSSAEAEYHAIVTGAAEALAVQALVEEMGWKMSCECSHRLVCGQGGGVSTWFGETATHRVEVFVGPGISSRTEDRDQEDQWTRQPRRLSDEATRTKNASNPCSVAWEQGGGVRSHSCRGLEVDYPEE